MNDLKFAIRQSLRSPGFTSVAVLTLALGVTVNGIVFSFTNDFFLRPLPAQDPDRLVVIAQTAPIIGYQIPMSHPDAVDLRRTVEPSGAAASDMARVFSGLMAYCEQQVHWSRTGEATERAWVHAVTDNYFSLLGAQPERGRFFLPGDAPHPGASPVLVLTHDTWRNRFGADPDIVGRTVRLNGLPFSVIGVAKPGFVGASWGTAVSGFVPVTMLTELVGPWALNPGNSSVFVMGRLQPAATLGEAQAATEVAWARLVKANPGYYVPNSRPVVIAERLSRPSPYISHRVPAIIAALTTLALLVLGIAAANVANLHYARVASRTYEIAIRSALGASRGSLLRGLLAEGLVIALAAGAVGVLASLCLTPIVVAALPTPATSAPAADTGADWRLLAFGFGLSLVTGIAAGLAPALQATRLAVQPLLKARGETATSRRVPMRRLLVIGQVAVSCVVLSGAGLALRSLQHLLQTPLGFDPHHLVVASFDLGKQRYDPARGRQFHARLLDRVRTIPGVRDASLADSTPMDTRVPVRGGVVPEGQAPDARLNEVPVACIVAEQTALRTLGFPLLAGREFSGQDGIGAPLVAVVNQSLANRFWPDQSPLGRRISVQGDVVEVVGLLGETRYDGIQDGHRPLLIQPLAQNYRDGVTLIVRTQGAPDSLVSALETVVRELDPDLPLFGVHTMAQQIATSPSGLLPYRVGAALAGSQGLVALFLAALGIFGLVSFNVSCRTREIGIRMALGATRAGVIRLAARSCLALVLVGLGAGMALSMLLARRFSGLLYQVSPTDGWVLAGVVAVVLGSALLAAWIPARRAVRVDPMEALRAE